jgi:hypothetical protein
MTVCVYTRVYVYMSVCVAVHGRLCVCAVCFSVSSGQTLVTRTFCS